MASQLPEWTDKFKQESGTPGERTSFHYALRSLGDQYLCQVYLALPIIDRASLYAEYVEDEMVDRFCSQNAGIPELVLMDE